MVGNLRTRLLALHVLEAVLPACESGVEDDQMAQVVIFCYKLSHFLKKSLKLLNVSWLSKSRSSEAQCSYLLLSEH